RRPHHAVSQHGADVAGDDRRGRRSPHRGVRGGGRRADRPLLTPRPGGSAGWHEASDRSLDPRARVAQRDAADVAEAAASGGKIMPGWGDALRRVTDAERFPVLHAALDSRPSTRTTMPT